LEEKAALGIAWDGDFDRCFFFDEQGTFIEGYYIIGLLAERFLQRYPGAKILHDVRLAWNSAEVVEAAGGIPVAAVSGHALMKARLREEDAVYGGEMSAHHYFKDFFYCDSGMIPWLVVLQAMSTTGKSLAELVGERMKRYPASGEINSTVADAPTKIVELEARYAPHAVKVDHLDGLSVEYENWRFNLRMSNTEPLLRLNVEARGDEALMKEKTDELLMLIRA
jgi:phosphomannomutase/phosphomannomutase/phosphoglucomutase